MADWKLALRCCALVAIGSLATASGTELKAVSRGSVMDVRAPHALAGPEGPTLVTHPVETFRDIVRCFASFDGAIWFGTYGDGLYRLKDGALTRFTSENSPLLENRVNCLAVRGGELWIGTCAGINVLAGGEWRSYTEADGVAHHIYHAVRVDSSGRVWVGTTGKGLSIFSGDRWRTLRISDGLAGDWVNDVLEAPRRVFWVASLGGVARGGPDGGMEVMRSPDFPLYRNAVALAAQGDAIWIGLSEAGLFMWEAGVWYRPPPELLPAPTVRALAVDGAGRLWIGTESGIGVYHAEEGWDVRGASAGLDDRDVRTLHHDVQNGALWAGTAAGSVYRRGRAETSWRLMVRRGKFVAAERPAGRKETHR